jgi:GNAT superfamily N-acetyltransferase
VWTDAQWQAQVSQPNQRTWVAYQQGAVAGYYELLMSAAGDVEIQYFGLVAEFFGQGFGGALLTHALQSAWAWPGTQRVWVHTCTLDHPSALANYQARGLRLYQQELSGEALI